jgi:hypothetical protein
MASLTIVIDGVEQRFPLESAAVTLGRGLESDLRLKDIKASRRHCQIVKTAKGYQCVDLSSGNGTYLNGVQIKSQMLSAGDKITIGSTTIEFQEEAAVPKPPPRPAPARGSTGKLPSVPPAAPPAPKTAASKMPTERVPVAPTRKITAKLDAVKASSQTRLKPAASAPSKSGTRLHKTTGRTPSPRPARGAGDAPRKRRPALLVGGLAAVLLAAGGGAYFLLGSKDDSERVRATIEQLVKKAHDAEAAEHYPEAIQEYRKAYDLCQGDRFKVRASDLQKHLQQLEARHAPLPELRPVSEPPAEKGPDIAAKRAEIGGKFKLSGDPQSADWSGAIKEWNELLKSKMSADLKGKVEAEIRGIQGMAKDDFGRLRKKSEALAQENKMAEALDLLKQQLPRFEATETLPELEAAIKQYDK